MSSAKKTNTRNKLSGPEQVAAFMSNLEHPLKEEIGQIRNIILSTDDQITEHMKWNAPSFRYEGEDRITFNLQGKGWIRLVFHCGAKGKDRTTNEPLIEDTSGILTWKSADRAILEFTDKSDVYAKEAKLREIITKWLKVI